MRSKLVILSIIGFTLLGFKGDVSFLVESREPLS